MRSRIWRLWGWEFEWFHLRSHIYISTILYNACWADLSFPINWFNLDKGSSIRLAAADISKLVVSTTYLLAHSTMSAKVVSRGEQRMGKVHRKPPSSPLKVPTIHPPGFSKGPSDSYSIKCGGTMVAQHSLLPSKGLPDYGKGMINILVEFCSWSLMKQNAQISSSFFLRPQKDT